MKRVITKNFGVGGIGRLGVARQHGAYVGLRKARRLASAHVMQEIASAQLRERVDLGPLLGDKLAHASEGERAIFFVHADESFPGSCGGRVVLMRDPHLVLEGALIAAHAVKAEKISVSIRFEYGEAFTAFSQAVEEARDAGLIGDGGVVKDVLVLRSATSLPGDAAGGLVQALEGACVTPSRTVSDVAGRPPLVCDVETLATLPFILREGAKAFRAMGTEGSSGTKLVSLSGCVRRPGIYEVEMGTPVSMVLKDEAGGFEGGRALKALLPGSLAAAVLSASEALACTVDFESFSDAGSRLGNGGMIVLDESASVVSLLADVARVFAQGSCGQCAPCREGAGWIAKILARIEKGLGRPDDLQLVADLAQSMADLSRCAFGRSMAMPVLSGIAKFRREFEEAVYGGRKFLRSGG